MRQGAGRGHHACRLLLPGGDLDDNELYDDHDHDDDDHDHDDDDHGHDDDDRDYDGDDHGHDDDDHDHDCHMRRRIGSYNSGCFDERAKFEHNAYFNLFRQNIKKPG